MNRRGGVPRGFSYAEVVAAFTVFGVALSGTVMAVATQLRLVEALEGRAYLVAAQGTTLQVVANAPGEGGLTYTYIIGSGANDISATADTWAARLGAGPAACRDVRPAALPVVVAYPLSLTLDPGAGPFEHLRDVALDGGLVETGGQIVAVVQVQETPP